MTKSELIQAIHKRQGDLTYKESHAAVNFILHRIIQSLMDKDRVEVRDFGSFSLHYYPPRFARNPRSGAAVPVMARFSPRFKPGKKLRLRIDHIKTNARKPRKAYRG